MFEGALIWNSSHEENNDGSRWFIGEDMYTVFKRVVVQLADGEQPDFLRPIEHMLNGKIAESVKEHKLGKILG